MQKANPRATAKQIRATAKHGRFALPSYYLYMLPGPMAGKMRCYY